MTKALIELLDWCGQHSALLIAVAGFASSVAIAKITSGLDLKRTLVLRRFETYEKAISQLTLKLNVYYNIMSVFQTLHEQVFDMGILKMKVAILLSLFGQLGNIEKEDRELSGIVLYSNLPSYDTSPFMKEAAQFLALLQDFSCRANSPIDEESVKQFVPDFINGIKRIEPLVAKEADHLNAIHVQLHSDIHKDKTIKKVLRLK